MLTTQGVHHITLNGADRATSIRFWSDVLGMPFVFEQPNLDQPSLNHLYFDPGDGRMITVFTDEDRVPGSHQSGAEPGAVHHLAFDLDRAHFDTAAERLRAAGYAVAERDRGFMDSLYFREPLGHLIELACYKVQPPEGRTIAELLAKAHELRVARGAAAIETEDCVAAAETLA